MPRAPAFWRADGAAARCLAPLGLLYGAVAAQRLRARAPRAALPTIVVGGLTAGGDGKTPLVMALADLLVKMGERPALLTRGYGGRGRGGPFVAGAATGVDAVGDEAPLLARHGLTIVGADRAASAELAHQCGATALILDDGFHSRRLAADYVLLAIDSDYRAGNGRCLPAGPLRAPLAAQIAAADALVVIGAANAALPLTPTLSPHERAEGAGCSLRHASHPLPARRGEGRGEGQGRSASVSDRAPKPSFRAQLQPEGMETFAGARVVAFAGIGRPEKFFRTLTATGAEIVATQFFPDHHRYSARDMAALAELARRHDARLVTTEKDALRLPPDAPAVDLLPVRLALADAAAMTATLARALEAARLSRVS